MAREGAVAITGVSGYIGSRLVELAAERAPDRRIVGLDIREPAGAGAGAENLTFHRADVRDPGLADVLREEGVDTVVHLAFFLDAIHDTDLMRDVNVGGTANVLDACAAAGVEKVVLASSGTAYGAYPDNPDRLTEDHPLRGNPDYYYSAHKVEQERLCDAFEADHPDVVVTRLRPSIVMGPHVDNFISRFIMKRLFITLRGADPPIQLVHEDDAADAFWRAVEVDAPGAYNIGAHDAVSMNDLRALGRVRVVRVPERVAFPMAGLLWRLRLVEAPPGELHFAAWPWVVDNSRARKVLDWEPRHTSRDALTDMLRAKGILAKDAA